MNELKIKVSGDSGVRPALKIDGKTLSCKKNQFGSSEAVFHTDKEVVELSVYRYLEINSPFWLLASLLFFVISIFGIFDARYDKRCISIAFRIKLRLQPQSEIRLSLNNFKESKINYETQCECEEIENECFIDEGAKRKLTFLRVLKVVFWLALVVLAVVLLANR